MNPVPTGEIIEQAVRLAGRAPSLHNSQPWRWVFDGTALRLFAVAERMLPTTDPSGRQLILSCGIALDHLRAAMAAAGWRTHVVRFPNPNRFDHLATVRFTPTPIVTDADRERVAAITTRRTDRLPFTEPKGWADFAPLLRTLVDPDDALLDVLGDDSRPRLSHASELTIALRRYESDYQAELQWWAGHVVAASGIPRSALINDEERDRVAVGRTFPTTHGDSRRSGIVDHSRIVVLSTDADDHDSVLRCGEAMSAVLLECTVAGYATCTLTHLTELPRSRTIVGELTGRTALPQALIRVGNAPAATDAPARTPRRPLAEILRIADTPSAP
ncbi:NAD(P)H nitroreductase [Nocardia sp. CDC159]|uniref:NAD(P)H nitroreductase n=1 Tax=Nocardia pulmonis TaxID=2951408 RepID=A0A9X2E6B2_9NOCA|nr:MULTISPECIES: NAD(P)H nitroreductase [Nocardia]MCM6772411.1 NAD(P)H nitroreductase [Nocardia pulmonis]MCM6784931.1 NAD(P)H nitroreductase [Nocardia sp. CDC159]